MNRIHEKNLRTLLAVSDSKALISDEARFRIEQMERRMTRFFGRFMEMNAETLAYLVNDLADEKVFAVPKPPKPPKPTPEEYISKMSRGAVEVELEKRGIKTTGDESAGELRNLLLESVQETAGKPETE